MSQTTDINYDIDRPSDAWMHAVVGLLVRCLQIDNQLGWRFFGPITKGLRRAGCPSYADWLTPPQKHGGVQYPPVDQTRLVEITALTAIQTGLKRNHFDPASHPVLTLEPNQVKELRDLQDKALRAVMDRLSDLENERQGDGPYPPNMLRYGENERVLPNIPWRLLDALWGNVPVPVDKTVEKVWGYDESESAIKSALQRVNRVLLDLGVPWSYGRKAGFFVEK